VTKAKAWKGVSWECNLGITFALLGVWGNELTHSQVNSHLGNWKPYAILNLQKGILRIKAHWIKEFLMLLKSSWNLDV
jgi:hypothetical protein